MSHNSSDADRQAQEAQRIAEKFYRDEGPALNGAGRAMRCKVCSKGWVTSGPWASGPQHNPPCPVEELQPVILSALQQAQAPPALQAERDELLAALRKVPLCSMTEDALGWQCAGCGSVSGVHADGSNREEACVPDCYVTVVEAAINKAEGK